MLNIKKRNEYYTFIPCIPVAKQSVRTAKSHFYVPKKQVDYVKMLKRHFDATYRWSATSCLKPMLEGFVFIEIVFMFPQKKSLEDAFYMGVSDFDNLTKPILDSMEGIIFKNDKQVVHAIISKVKSFTFGVEVTCGKILLNPMKSLEIS